MQMFGKIYFRVEWRIYPAHHVRYSLSHTYSASATEWNKWNNNSYNLDKHGFRVSSLRWDDKLLETAAIGDYAIKIKQT